jgi:hypothetical protein
MAKSEELQQKAYQRIDRCGSMKTLLTNPPVQNHYNTAISEADEPTMKRTHSLERCKTMGSCTVESDLLNYMKSHKKSTRLGFLSKYIDTLYHKVKN